MQSKEFLHSPLFSFYNSNKDVNGNEKVPGLCFGKVLPVKDFMVLGHTFGQLHLHHCCIYMIIIIYKYHQLTLLSTQSYIIYAWIIPKYFVIVSQR